MRVLKLVYHQRRLFFLLFFIPIYFIYRTLEIFSQSPNCLFTKYIYELRVRLI